MNKDMTCNNEKLLNLAYKYLGYYCDGNCLRPDDKEQQIIFELDVALDNMELTFRHVNILGYLIGRYRITKDILDFFNEINKITGGINNG